MAEFNIKDLGTIKCPKCGYDNINGSKTCGKCNSRLVLYGNKSCPRCGLKLKDTDKKCPKCGYVLNGGIKKLLFTLVQILVIVGLGYIVIKYGGGRYKWPLRVLVLFVGLCILTMTTKEYHKVVEFIEDPIVAKLEKEQEEKFNKKGK